MSVSESIIKNLGPCREHSALGELGCVDSRYGSNKQPYEVAVIYWWKEPPPTYVVEEWVRQGGGRVFEISRVLRSDDGFDGIPHTTTWNISFIQGEEACLDWEVSFSDAYVDFNVVVRAPNQDSAIHEAEKVLRGRRVLLKDMVPSVKEFNPDMPF